MYFLIVLGMIQRLEKLKKNAFASCCLFGEDNKNAISGKLPCKLYKIHVKK